MRLYCHIEAFEKPSPLEQLYTVHLQNGRSRSKFKIRAMPKLDLGDISKILHQLPDPRTVYSEDVARVDVLSKIMDWEIPSSSLA